MARKPLFISAAATEQVLTWQDMIAGLRAAYAVPHSPHTSYRAVARGNKTWIRGLVSVPPASSYMGAKIFGVGRQKRVSYLVPLFDQETAEMVALVDALHITALRTAATSAVAIDILAPQKPVTVGVLGSGTEAQGHLRATSAVRKVTSARVFSPTSTNREAFAKSLSAELGFPIQPVATAAEAVSGADVILAAARSHDETPILSGDWLRPGVLLVSIGSTLPEQRELDVRTVEVCDLIVCDMIHEVADETGDFIAVKRAGVPFDHKMMSLNDLVIGNQADRVKQARQPMFKSVGAAVQDVTVAEIACRLAAERGLAVELPMEISVRVL